MIKELLLVSALTFAPTTLTILEDTPTTDTTEEDSFDWQAWLEQWFTPQQIAMVMSWVAYTGTIIGMIYKIKQLAKENTNSAENIKNLILKEVGDKVDNAVATQLANSINSVIKTCDHLNEVITLLAKVEALSQENTPESRVAILDLISRIGVVDKETIDNAKETIKNEVEADKKTIADTNDNVDKVIENTTSKDDGTTI